MILNLVLHKGMSKVGFFCAFVWLFLSFTSEPGHAQQTSCDGVNNGSSCIHNGPTVNNCYNCTYIQPSDPTKPAFQSPKPTFVDVGNLKFNLLGCKSSQGRVQCNLAVINPTALDRTLFVASQQHGGISSLALRNSIGNTTLIDSSGVSYVAEAVSFAENGGSETGQSFFTVYSGTTPKLSVVFTGVDTPATIQRLDLVVGENTKNGIILDTLRYRIKPNSQRSSADLQGDPQQAQPIPQLSPERSQPPSNQSQPSLNQPQPSSNQSNSQPSSGGVIPQVGDVLRGIGDVELQLKKILHW